jgi:hypothetical protein
MRSIGTVGQKWDLRFVRFPLRKLPLREEVALHGGIGNNRHSCHGLLKVSVPQICPELTGARLGGAISRMYGLALSPQDVERIHGPVEPVGRGPEHQQVPNAPNFEHIVRLIPKLPSLSRSLGRAGCVLQDVVAMPMSGTVVPRRVKPETVEIVRVSGRPVVTPGAVQAAALLQRVTEIEGRKRQGRSLFAGKRVN